MQQRIAPVKASSGRSRRSRRKSSKIHLPFAYRVERKTFVAFMLVVGIGLIATALLLWYIFFEYLAESPRSEDSPKIDYTGELGQTSTSVPDLSEEQKVHAGGKAMDSSEATAEFSLQEILMKLRETTGIGEAKSLLLFGTYEENGRIFDLKLATKMPGSVRKTLRDETLEIICRYDGIGASVEVKQPTGSTVERPLEETVYREALVLEGAFLRLGDHGEGLSSPKYSREANQDYEGRECWTIISQGEGRAQITHLIEIENGLERVRYRRIELDGAEHRLSIHFSDFKKVDGYTFPHAYALKMDGVIHGIARIASVQRNAGLMPWMFGQKP